MMIMTKKRKHSLNKICTEYNLGINMEDIDGKPAQIFDKHWRKTWFRDKMSATFYDYKKLDFYYF